VLSKLTGSLFVKTLGVGVLFNQQQIFLLLQQYKVPARTKRVITIGTKMLISLETKLTPLIEFVTRFAGIKVTIAL